jgi:hypothetical protein
VNLADLKNSVSELSEDELLALLTEIRSSRRAQKASNRKTSSSSGAKKPSGSSSGASLEALLGSLDSNQAAALLQKIGGKP